MTRFIKYLLAIVVIMLSMTSCDDLGSGRKNMPSEVTQVRSVAGNDIDRKIYIRDSVYHELLRQIEVLNVSLDSMNTELNNQITQVKDNEKSIDRWRIVAIAAIVLAIIAIILALYTNMHCIYKDVLSKYFEENNKQIKRVINEHFDDANLRNRKASAIPSLYSPSMHSYNATEFKMLEKRVTSLENEIKICRPSQRNEDAQTQRPTVRIGYATTNYKDMFTEVLPSNREGCVYKITFINDNEGEFDLIELSMMQQTPNYKDVVEIVGGCSLDEATKYNVMSLGKCKKIESGKNIVWKVIEKLKIKTLK